MPALKVAVEASSGTWHEYRFAGPFKIGRLEDCEVCIDNPSVSRVHASATYDNGRWGLHDLGSVNGVLVNGERVSSVVVEQLAIVKLGADGPEVKFEVEAPQEDRRASDVAQDGNTLLDPYIQHYLSARDGEEPAGERTLLIRRAFAQVEKKQQQRIYLWAAALLLLMVGIGGLAYHEHRQLIEQRDTAERLFYAIKEQDVALAGLDRSLATSNNPAGNQQLATIRAGRRQLEDSYNEYLATLQIYNPKLTEKQRLLLRVARIFGECELEMPPGFEAEVNRYIERWRSSGRLKAAILTAQQNGYTETITRELLARGLAPQFFYLALQESNFNPYAVGPRTRKGFAKGMWQFIPETAVKYNLHLGPLVDQGRPDPGDERHNYVKETKAASLYLQDLMATDAQASGFLVMACYNYGEMQVLPLVRSMPANPKDRNFWKLLAKHRSQIPQETYDYVFYIASAAVIGENPRLFGFDFDNPLANH